MLQMAKKSQLQIRVSEQEKELIRTAAARSGQDMSTWILNTLLSVTERQFRALLKQFGSNDDAFVFAELIDLLSAMSGTELMSISNPEPELEALRPYLQNYVCALVEQKANQIGLVAPAWASSVLPLQEPVFGTELKSLRPHLLCNAPIAFKRRNIFVDATLGARV